MQCVVVVLGLTRLYLIQVQLVGVLYSVEEEEEEEEEEGNASVGPAACSASAR
jgi:hypothetical protein